MNEQMKKGMMDTQSKSYQKLDQSEDPQGMALGNMLAQYQSPQEQMPMDPNDPNFLLNKKYAEKQSGLLTNGTLTPPQLL